MPVQQKDFILRLIEELGAALREMRNALIRGGAPVATEIVEKAVVAQGELLGEPGPALRSLDAETAASLIVDVRQLELWADLVLIEAEGRRLAGEHEAAAHLEGRAAILAGAAARRRMDFGS